MKIAIFSPFCSRITKKFLFSDSFGRVFSFREQERRSETCFTRPPTLPGAGFSLCWLFHGLRSAKGGRFGGKPLFPAAEPLLREVPRWGAVSRSRLRSHAPGFGPEHDAEFRFPIRPTSPARSPCGGAGARCAGRHAAPRRRCPFRRACSRACRSPDCLRPSNMRGLRCG